MTDEEVIKAMKQHWLEYGNWPRAEALLVRLNRHPYPLKVKLDAMIDAGTVSLGLDGRYRIVHQSGGN